MKTFFQNITADIAIYKDTKEVSLKDYIQVLNPRLYPVILVRVASFFYKYRLGIIAKIVSTLNFVLFGCDIARGAKIGAGFYMPHPSGVVIGEFATIGENCIIHQGVTLGARGEEYESANPTLEDFVEIGTGAKLLGKLQISKYAVVGANSVVLQDIPKFAVVVGIPARVVRIREVI